MFLLKYISIVLFLILSTSLYAQRPFTPITADPFSESWRWQNISELNDKEVFTITEDKEGNYWFGCANEIIKYNGYSYKRYNIPDSCFVGYANHILVSDLGIFYGSYQGLSLLKNGEWQTIIKNSPDQSNVTGIKHFTVTAISQVEDMVCVVFNQGILLYTNTDVHFFSSLNINNSIKEFYPNYNFHTILDDIKPKNLWLNGFLQMGDSYLIPAKEQKILNVSISNGIANKLHVNSYNTTNAPISSFRDNYTLFEDDNSYWLSNTGNNALLLKIKGKQFKTYNVGKLFDGQNITSNIIKLSRNRVAIGAHGCFYTIENEIIKRYSSPKVPLSQSTLVTIFEDSKGQIWFINQRSKVFLFHNNADVWKTYSDLIYQLTDKEGKTWFISKDNKLVYEKNNNWFYYDTKNGLIDHPLTLFQTKRGDLWCAGSHQNKAAVAFFRNKQWHIQALNLDQSISKKGILEDSKGNLWFASRENYKFVGKGVAKLTYNSFDSLQWEYFSNPVYSLGKLIEYNGDIYGSTAMGIIRAANGSIDNTFNFGTEIDVLDKTSKGSLLAGTRTKGLYVIDNDGKISNHNINNGLLSNTVIDICPLKNNMLWLATDVDVSFYDGKEWTNNCLPAEFNLYQEGSSIQVGGNGDVWISLASKAWVRQLQYAVHSDKFFTVRYTPDKNPPETFIDFAIDTIEQTGNAYISWSGIDYMSKTASNQLLFSYKIDNEDWTPFTRSKGNTFLSLKSGKHTFMVRAKDLDLNIDPTPSKFNFVVLPPIYKRTWFILTILSFVIIIAFLLTKIISRNKKLYNFNQSLNKSNQNLEKQKAEIVRINKEVIVQKERVQNIKLRFFTNISHELRTPLTLIKGAIESIKNSNYNSEIIDRYSAISERNVKILLDLINEILEFRKIESGHAIVNAQKINLKSFINDIGDCFRGIAEDKNINFSVNIDSNSELWGDKNMLTKVLYNLLTNAFKFSHYNNSVTITVSDKAIPKNPKLVNLFHLYHRKEPLNSFVELVIEDEGIGISKDSINEIFDRYYQVDSSGEHLGSGIGLAITKQLLRLHKADIIVASERNVGTRFTLHFPVGKSHFSDQSQTLNLKNDMEYSLVENQTPVLKESVGDNKDSINIINGLKLLIVEDNDDLRLYLKDIFKSHFTIIEAKNGEEGFNAALTKNPDLILSDVLMPKMSGTDMCKKLKSDITTSHIPVILLTARASDNHKLEGLQTGADVYISKPFDRQLLELQVNNLLATRNKIIEKIKKEETFAPTSVSKNSLDQEFVGKLNKIVENNIANDQFGVEMLAEELHLSRQHLHSKLKSLIGYTPHEYIISQRIAKAVSLLKASNLSISEIAFQSGFSDSSHMGRLIKNKYNQTPKEIRNT